MFGHNDNRESRNSNPAAPPDGVLTNDDNKSGVLVGDMSTPYPPADLPTPTSAPATPSDSPVDTSSFGASDTTAAVPVPDPAPTPAPVADDSTPAPTSDSSAIATLPHPDELLDIKQQALQHLSPLVDHLDQNPSDRFRTTMMMIQASDNAALIKTAYDAALQITDDKERAQALLDLINEINYFTHNKSTSETAAQS